MANVLKKNRKKIFWLFFLLLLVLGGVFYAKIFSKSKTTANFQLEKLQMKGLKKIVLANGTLNPVIVVNIGTQISGTVNSIRVDYNSPVKKDQVLLTIDDTNLKAQIQQSKANVQSSAADLAVATADMHRYQSLYEKKFVTKQELDQKIQKYKNTSAALSSAQAQLAKDQNNLSFATVTSPIDGTVIDRSIDVGQTVAASYQTPTLFKVAQDLKKMQIITNISEADLGMIKEGQQATFTVDAFGGKTYRGKVYQIRLNPSVQSNVVNYLVVINVDNSSLDLLPGMTANVSIVVAEKDSVLTVPNAALRFKPTATGGKTDSSQAEGDSSASLIKKEEKQKDQSTENSLSTPARVYILKDQKPVAVPIKIGISDSKNTEVLSDNLPTGSEVIVGENSPDKTSRGFQMRLF